MAIRDDDVAAVRAATDIVALIGEHAALRQQGRRWVGLCPFHSEKTPSFSVNAEEGLYYCFGCQASGDAISFVRAVEHLDFVDAVRYLADRAGVVVHEDQAASADRRARARLFEAMEAAVEWYHQRLLSASDAGPARQYLRSRGYDGDTVRKFRLGWAPAGWDELCRALRFPTDVLGEAGLGFVNRRNNLQDAFRSRVLFPICDPSGRPVALGGRILPSGTAGASGTGRPEPKYKNSQESQIYSKRRTLYALHWAKHDVVAQGEVVVCEGYTDVIGCFQVGVPRAVATCGTALAEEHFHLLRNFAKRIVLAYDADAAGQSATSRVYEWERKHEVDVAVAAMPPGADPGDLARRDPEALRSAVANARPFLRFRVDRVLDGADLSTAEGRARAAGAAVDAVAEHPDPLVRDPYVMLIADRCRLEPDRLRTRLGEALRRGPRRPAGSGRAGGPVGWSEDRSARSSSAGDWAGGERRERFGSEPRRDREDRAGLEALRFMVHRREEIQDCLDELLFGDLVQRRAFTVLYDEGQGSLAAVVERLEQEDPPVAALLARLSVEEPTIPADPLADPVEAVVTELVRNAVRRALAELQAQARSVPTDQQLVVNPDLVMLRRWLEDLEDPGAATVVAERLVAWLVAQGQEERQGKG